MMKKIGCWFLSFITMACLCVDIGLSEEQQAGSEETLPLTEEEKAKSERERLLQLVEQARKKSNDVDIVIDVSDCSSLGEPNAKLTLIEFSDLQCPYCKRHLMTTMPKLENLYIETGKVKYVVFDFPLEAKHPLALKAAEATRCAAEQGKFWEMRNHLYTNQKALHPALLEAHATTIGLDTATFKYCLESGKYAKAIQKHWNQGAALGVRATPTFFLGFSKENNQVHVVRKINGAESFEIFRRELDLLLGEDS